MKAQDAFTMGPIPTIASIDLVTSFFKQVWWFGKTSDCSSKIVSSFSGRTTTIPIVPQNSHSLPISTWELLKCGMNCYSTPVHKTTRFERRRRCCCKVAFRSICQHGLRGSGQPTSTTRCKDRPCFVSEICKRKHY